MKGGNLLLPAAVLALPLVLILSFRGREGPYQVYVPTGYIKEANRLISEGKLVYDCPSERIEPRGLSAGEELFVRNSYLARDLARWNAGDRTPFVVEHEERRGGPCSGLEVLQVNESYHNQRLPSYAPTSWRGRLFLRQGLATVTLSSPQRLLEVARPPWRRLPLPARAYEDAWLDNTADARSERMALKMFEAGRSFASLEHVGDQLAVEAIQLRPEVFLNGCTVRQGMRLRLDDGDWVRFFAEGTTDQRYLVETGSAAGLVSFVNVVNGEVRRRTFRGRLDLAEDLTRAIDVAVIRGLEGGGRDDFDVHLTLDGFFHDLLGRRLAAFARGRYGRRPLRAGVTLLEAETGRVLALASYPRPGDLEDLRLKRDAHAALLGRNHNFLQHPVGSAAKPFLAAAALASRPRLASLELPCFAGGNPPEAFLGYDFGTYNLPPDCDPAAEPIRFRRFLEVSSNRYMLALGMLAMARWQGGRPVVDPAAEELPDGDRFTLGGTPFSRRPVLDVVKNESLPGMTELADLEDEPFFRLFRDLFGHPVHFERGWVADDLDLATWEPVLAAAGGEGDRGTALGFSTVTAERVNLRANLIQQLRQDLYTTLLGLGNNRWSNVQLAESLARLVTGRAVEARLVEAVDVPSLTGDGAGGLEPEPEAAATDSEAWSALEGGAEPDRARLFSLEERLAAAPDPQLPLDEASRRLILTGMTDVVERDPGTAHALAAELAEINALAPAGVRYTALAKTGTPSTDLAQVRRGPAEPAPGAVERYSGRDQVNDAVLLLAVSRTAAGETRTLALAVSIEAQGGSNEAVALAAELLRPLLEAYWPEDWLEMGGL